MLGAENLNPSVTYRWTKSSDGRQIQVGTNSSTFSFAPVRLSDAANYSCVVAITSGYLTTSITATASLSVAVQSKFQNLNSQSSQSVPLCCYNMCSSSIFSYTD